MGMSDDEIQVEIDVVLNNSGLAWLRVPAKLSGVPAVVSGHLPGGNPPKLVG
jgi:hypothetical protein